MANLFAPPLLLCFGAAGATDGAGGSILPFGDGGLLAGAWEDFGALAGGGLIFDGAGAGAFVFAGDGAWLGLFTAGGGAVGDNAGGLALGGKIGAWDDGTGLSSGGVAGGDIVGEDGDDAVGGSAVGGEDGGSLLGVHFHAGDSGLGAGDGTGDVAAAEISKSATVRTCRTVEEAIAEWWSSSVKKMRKIREYIEGIKLNQEEDRTADKIYS